MMLLSLVSLCLLKCVFSSPYAEVDGNTLLYLQRYGYIQGSNPNSSALISGEAVDQAIMEFQAFAGINITGKLDDETVYYMSLPRCGVKDKVGYGTSARRKKRYALQGSRWRVKTLNYNIARYPSSSHRLTRAEVDDTIGKALRVWSRHTDLTFQRKKSGKVHIEIEFVSGEHGDGDAFDGRGGTLAHAFFPVYGGDAHFDDAERWSINSRYGTDLFHVAAHEFGHSLGLSHSDIQASLMAPFYKGYDPDLELHEDDIRGIQKLYGKKTSTKTTTTTTTTRRPISAKQDKILCSARNSIDAIINDPNDNTYVFKGTQVWRLTDSGIESGYPRKISEVFKGLPSNIDGAFTWTNNKMFFFKGANYYRVANNRVDKGYPKKISQGFTGIPNNIDTVFVWSGNGMIYFFKGDQYYRFDPEADKPVNNLYPRKISLWEDLPNDIDAALQYKNGYTYFFKGNDYFRFNDQTFKVDDSSDPKYPRSTSEWWYGCSSSLIMQNDRGDVQLNNVDEDNDAGFRSGGDGRKSNHGYLVKPKKTGNKSSHSRGNIFLVVLLLSATLYQSLA